MTTAHLSRSVASWLGLLVWTVVEPLPPTLQATYTFRGMVRQGLNADQIVSAFVDKYGKVILAAPPAEGFDLMAWILPFIVLLSGFVFVYWLIRVWLIRKPALASGTAGTSEIPESYQKRIERELKDLER